MRFTNATESSETCVWSDNVSIETISWSSNIGPVGTATYISGLSTIPVNQQQVGVNWECGANPTMITDQNPDYAKPNPNYQFTVSNFCMQDIYNKLCFDDYGHILPT